MTQNTKSQLAKLLATENITVQENNVKTASFDVVDRILTLPIFKTDSKDVTDMLIAHECAHALYTPTKSWQDITDDDELRSYINVLEDTRIDKLVQSKYPGIVKNYENGFDILNSKNFFGIKDKNINTDLMLIDKINLRSKSLNRLSFIFSNDDNKWLKKVDAIKTFKDVVKVAKDMLNWQKKQIDQMKKLPNFDELAIVKSYELSDKKPEDSETTNEDSNNDDNAKEADKQNASEGKTESESDKEKPAVGDKTKKVEGEDKKKSGGAVGSGGDGALKSITNNWFEGKKEQLMDTKTSYSYKNIPDPILDKVIRSNKDFVNDMKQAFIRDKQTAYNYLPYLKKEYKKFLNDSKKTIMYLVKEFELKKAATAYKRSTIDKTGVIDPLKLKDYKFSDDLFKRLTILPDAKNHGMMMLLDWSGSMSDSIYKTVQQLIQLVYFCHKVNIPYDVYFFTSEFENDNPRLIGHGRLSDGFKYKSGDMALDSVKLVNVANHKLKKIQLDESMMYLYWLSLHYDNRYSYRDYDYSKPDSPNIPREYYLGSTPLNEALVVMLKLVPMFKEKYKVEKMNFITLTDGGGNYGSSQVFTTNDDGKLIATDSKGDNDVYIYKKKQYMLPRHIWGSGKTAMYLNMLRKLYNIKTIGFYLIKRIRGYDAERYFKDSYNSKLTWDQKDKLYQKRKSDFAKNKVAVIKQDGYDDYYLVNAKDMKVENTDISQVNSDMKVGRIKQLFSKSMKGRITSRVLLNKFIEKVA